jgi:N-acetylmuramoyl-L-alanine amidase
MKYAIDIGHNCPPYDTGAIGIKREDYLTLAVGSRVISQLESLGYEIITCNPSKADDLTASLAKRCAAANNGKADVFVSIHFNCFNGQASGTEVCVTTGAGKKIAAPVLEEIVKLGFKNRGIKERDDLYVLNHTAMPAILVEGFFVDSSTDCAIFNRIGADAIASAIVKGLTGKTLPIQTKVPA